MEHLWSPWRYGYIASAREKPPSCIFCKTEDQTHDVERLILFRGAHNFVILNLFPYTSGHLMIAPFAHIDALEEAAPEQMSEMMDLSRRGVVALKCLYHPEGFNIGMNLGECAGAGVKDHIHLHIVPRWIGDSNFMTVTAETRVLPEELGVTYRRLSEVF
jgi:ATP adenylyltransferase